MWSRGDASILSPTVSFLKKTGIMQKKFRERTKQLNYGLAILEWACWTFLSVTTAVLAYSLLDVYLKAHFTGAYLHVVRTIGIFLIYLIIDSGLKDMLKAYIYERSTDKKPQSKSKDNIHKTVFLRIMMLLVIARFLATTTSSFWASPDIAELTVEKGNDIFLIQQAAKTDSINQVRINDIKASIAALEASEPKRLEAAKMRGNALVAKAINKGNRWQKEAYYKGIQVLLKDKDKHDRDYGQAIVAAQNTAKQLIAEEQQKLIDARQQLASTLSDTTGTSNISTLTNMAQQEQLAYYNNLNRRKNYIYLFDFIAAIVAVCVSIIRVKWQLATEDEKENDTAEKSIKSVLINIMEKLHTSALSSLEKLAGLAQSETENTPENDAENLPFSTAESPQLKTENDSLKKLENELLKKLEKQLLKNTFSTPNVTAESRQFSTENTQAENDAESLKGLEKQRLSAENGQVSEPENTPENRRLIGYWKPENKPFSKPENKTESKPENEQVSEPENKPEKVMKVIHETVDVSSVLTNIRNWYRRRHKTADNLNKYQDGKEILEELGYSVKEVSDTSLSITKQG